LKINPLTLAIPLVAALLGAWQLAAWYSDAEAVKVGLRVPGQDNRPPPEALSSAVAARGAGRLTAGDGKPSAIMAAWPQFRGPDRSGLAPETERVYKSWPAGGPKPLWRVRVGEGHAGAAVWGGRVYLVDYDRANQEDAVRCLSLDDGREIWRYSYPSKTIRNHGMSRTVAATDGQFLVTLGPKCQVCCLKAETGERVWKMDLVREYGATVPNWYAGQCPLLDQGRAIIAPGGSPLMMAVDLPTGKVLWRTENPGDWKMTHSSIMPVELGGVKQYVYCGNRGVVGVSAADGKLLWTWPNWKITFATIPSPLQIGSDRLFLTGGYGAGSEMVRFVRQGETDSVAEVYRLKPTVFGAAQHTPILYGGHLYGVSAENEVGPPDQLVCLDLDGRRVWSSGPKSTFGLGPQVLVDGVLYVLNAESGELVMVDLSAATYKELGRAKVLEGNDCWGPMAVAGGRLLLREGNHLVGQEDRTELVCIEIGPGGSGATVTARPGTSPVPTTAKATPVAEGGNGK
jgi:outer membrane protein assembly factor BamB